ncbi:MAG TPA: SDR family NAD(P)-dependent oxidoreductase, partial [Burkholderiales bacterium]|nr:SDR family NAD(P)-dependent oxidoreductase [Burkholderiales bacterium]
MDAALHGKVVLVTGAARRVGAAIVRRLHARGAAVLIHYRSSAADARDLAADLNERRPGSAAVAACDLLHGAELPRLVEAALTNFGRLDVLVNNA